MASIATLTKTFFLLTLSIAFPLAAHALPAENISPEAIVERSSSTGTSFRSQFEHPDGSGLSNEVGSNINVYRHYMNVSATHDLEKRSPPRRMNQCRPSAWPNGRMTFRSSFCNTRRGPKAYAIHCDSTYSIGGFDQVDPTMESGSCQDEEICVDYKVNPATPVAYCVSHENFVRMASTWQDHGNEALKTVLHVAAHDQAQLRVTNYDNTLWESESYIEINSEKCSAYDPRDCQTLQTQECQNCYGLTLAPLDVNTNTISTRVIVRKPRKEFPEPFVNVWLSQMTA